MSHSKHENFTNSSDALTHAIVLLALSHYLHLNLAHADVLSILFKACQEILSEGHARVLLSLLLLLLSHSLVLSSILRGRHLLLLLHRFALVSLAASAMRATATH